MATRIELPIETVKAALTKALDSEKRAEKSAKPMFAELHRKEIAALTVALNSLTETK